MVRGGESGDLELAVLGSRGTMGEVENTESGHGKRETKSGNVNELF